MNRHYFVADNLGELESVEHELREQGFNRDQIHVLSHNEARLDRLRVNPVNSILRRDIIRSGLKGLAFGAVIALVVLLVGFQQNTGSISAWVPYWVLGFVMLAFCLWAGGFIGIQKPNAEFRRYQPYLRAGKHILFVDTKARQEASLNTVTHAHRNIIRLHEAGDDMPPAP